jgi:hypothetical protein
MDAILTGSGDNQMADQDVCIAVGEDLTKHYPGYLWMVGCDHEAGTIQIDLQCDKPIGMERYGYLLHLSTVMGAGGQKAVMRAGGELLERFGLRRKWAHPDTADIARENGLDVSNNKNKSKH